MERRVPGRASGDDEPCAPGLRPRSCREVPVTLSGPTPPSDSSFRVSNCDLGVSASLLRGSGGKPKSTHSVTTESAPAQIDTNPKIAMLKRQSIRQIEGPCEIRLGADGRDGR